IAMACPRPRPKSSFSHVTICPVLTSFSRRPFFSARILKSSGVFPVLALMLSRYAFKVICFLLFNGKRIWSRPGQEHLDPHRAADLPACDDARGGLPQSAHSLY